MKVLFDTNAYTALKRGHTGVVGRFRSATSVLLPAVVLGELLYGFRYGSRFQHHFDELLEFIESPFISVVPVTMATADRYGRISSALKRKGTPLPTNDVWIAAQTVETGAELLSFDRHFDKVAGLVWSFLEW